MPARGQPPAATARPPSYTDITLEIERYLARAPRGTRARCAEAGGIDAAGFRHRMTERRGMRFSYEQLGAIAATVNAPPHWPYVSWEEGERFAALNTLIQRPAPTRQGA